MVEKKHTRAQFATRLGVIATTVGSAVGLGNMWRFPYEAGNGGGGAFMLLYILFILLLGIPVICAEFVIGRETRSNVLGAFKQLKTSRFWQIIGYIGILSSLMILSFYSVVAGWTIEYFVQSIVGNISSDVNFHEQFVGFTTGWRALLWTVVFLLINLLVIIRGVRKGLERMSNIMMPLLFIIIIIFCINSLTMPGASQGLDFLFRPDLSKFSWNVVLSALGQAFFSLSIGLGCMLTYASYFNDKTNIVRSAAATAGLDTLVAILAGIMIFPAVFTFGMSPAEGPTLMFEVLPRIFSMMPGGAIWATLFFFMLFLASLSSTISMSEISITFLTEQGRLSRSKACIVCTAIALFFGSLCALSFGPLERLNLFNLFNNISSNVLLPIGGMLISIFVGWILDRGVLRRQLTNNESIRVPMFKLIIFCLKFVAPVCLAIILIMGLIG